MTMATGANTVSTMPPKPQAMTPAELQELMDRHGLNRKAMSELLEVHRNTVWRWLKGSENINAANAALIRERLKTKKK